MKEICLIIGLLMASCQVSAQTSAVLVRNHPENTSEYARVEIKWVTSKVVYQDGVNIYRRVAGSENWEKLNDQPLVKTDRLSAELTEEIPEAVDFFDIVEELGSIIRGEQERTHRRNLLPDNYFFIAQHKDQTVF